MRDLSRLVLLFALSAAGCDRPATDDSSGTNGSADDGQVQKATCEVRTRTELADENEVAPNGQTGAKILAAVPPSLHTSLAWDFSTLSSGIEVEVPGAIGLSAVLDLSFTFPAEPRHFFEDRIVVEPSGDVDVDLDVVCEDYVTTVVDVSMATEDGTIALVLSGLTVRLGPDRPETDYVARPFLRETLAMSTPEVNFLKPVARAASLDKTLSMQFDYDGLSVSGDIIVYAETSSTTYEHLVAKW